MPYSLSQIRIFEAVAQYESYTRAAEKLFMTQPAVSMQIKQLEDNTGLALFERQGKRIVQTAAGLAMSAYSREILAQHQGMLNALEDLKNIHQGYIKVSAATTSLYFVTKMLANFSKLHEGITISLNVTNRKVLVEQLHNYESDLVIMGEPPTNIELHSRRLMLNPLVVIAPVGHPLAGQRNIPMQALVREKFIVRETGSGTRDAIKRFFTAHELPFVTGLEMGSNESIKYAVIAGLGLGIVSLHTIQLELDAQALVILDVEHFPIRRYWHLVTREGKRLSPAAQAFEEYMIAEAENYAQEAQRHFL